MRFSKSWNPEGEFNTQGMTKCECGQYYPTGWGSHGSQCPEAQKEDEDDE